MKVRDRRGSKRYDVSPILCRFFPSNGGVGVLRNVSMEGAFLLNSEPPPVGMECEIEFAEPPLGGYRLTGKVVRHDQVRFSRGFAVWFYEPHPRLLRAVYHGT
ncbi:MAG: PilZ domain-containing protein [Deltaproteobacteria bacterium]|nr:MAG: PilZ domain-containing protein [Deltaproteobacteria bacterium]